MCGKVDAAEYEVSFSSIRYGLIFFSVQCVHEGTHTSNSYALCSPWSKDQAGARFDERKLHGGSGGIRFYGLHVYAACCSVLHMLLE